MRILITGGTGQIGHELVRELAGLGEVVAPPRRELDLAEPSSIRDAVRALRPSLVVNAGAYTAVDRAESEAALAERVNAEAPAVLAAECRSSGAVLVHFSTDYVFDGAQRRPYVETDLPAPLNVYGRTKLEGEQAIVAEGGRYLILRTSWVYGLRGKNFVLTMLRLARERQTLSVVNDQVGAPTSSAAVARGVRDVLNMLRRDDDWSAAGVYHMSAGGSTTWYDFARRILADDPRSSEQVCREVRPVSTAEYPTAARRPLYSVLDNTKLLERFGVRLASWEEEWRRSHP